MFFPLYLGSAMRLELGIALGYKKFYYKGKFTLIKKKFNLKLVAIESIELKINT